jgi:hypothetical protein
MKVIAQWSTVRLVLTTAQHVRPPMACVAHVDRRIVSRPYPLVRFMYGGHHKWRDDAGEVPLSEIMTYEGWER